MYNGMIRFFCRFEGISLMSRLAAGLLSGLLAFRFWCRFLIPIRRWRLAAILAVLGQFFLENQAIVDQLGKIALAQGEKFISRFHYRGSLENEG